MQRLLTFYWPTQSTDVWKGHFHPRCGTWTWLVFQAAKLCAGVDFFPIRYCSSDHTCLTSSYLAQNSTVGSALIALHHADSCRAAPPTDLQTEMGALSLSLPNIPSNQKVLVCFGFGFFFFWSSEWGISLSMCHSQETVARFAHIWHTVVRSNIGWLSVLENSGLSQRSVYKIFRKEKHSPSGPCAAQNLKFQHKGRVPYPNIYIC